MFKLIDFFLFVTNKPNQYLLTSKDKSVTLIDKNNIKIKIVTR